MYLEMYERRQGVEREDVNASHHSPPTSPLFWVCWSLKLYLGQSGSLCKLTSTVLACGKLVLYAYLWPLTLLCQEWTLAWPSLAAE